MINWIYLLINIAIIGIITGIAYIIIRLQNQRDLYKVLFENSARHIDKLQAKNAIEKFKLKEEDENGN